MTQKLDAQTKAAADRVMDNPIFKGIRERRFDKAWAAIQNDSQLKAARNKLSIHELRVIIQHTADAFEL